VMYGYVLENRRSLRLLLALAAVPIAVAANSLRIVGTGLLVQYWDPDKAEGFFHTFSGWIIFVVSILLLFAVRRVLHCMLDRTLDRTRAHPGTDPNPPDLMTKPTVETRS
jgi:exosortase/archaeosortase family protein